jgi:hypothetical protein
VVHSEQIPADLSEPDPFYEAVLGGLTDGLLATYGTEGLRLNS